MRNILGLAVLALFVTSCGSQNCDCDLYVDQYVEDALNPGTYNMTSSTLAVQDTCVDAGIQDSVTTAGGAYLVVTRAECP